MSDLNTLAGVIGIEIKWNGTPGSEDSAALILFLAAAREAMANAAKHAKAEHLFIHVAESDSALRAAFTNDGQSPQRPVEETGGLLNLRHRLEKAGGQMRIDTEQGFRLAVTIPKKGADHALSSFNRGGSGDAPAAL